MYRFEKFDNPKKVRVDELVPFDVFRTTVGCPRNYVNAMFLGAKIEGNNFSYGDGIMSFSLAIEYVPVHQDVLYHTYYCRSTAINGLVDEEYNVYRADTMHRFIRGYVNTPLKETFSYQAEYEIVGKMVEVNE